jgi:hypothetical protein
VASNWGPLGTSATNWPIVPGPFDYEDGEFGGMMIGRGNWSTRRKPAPVPLCPLQIPHDLTWARTPAAAVGSQRLTAWATSRPVQALGHGLTDGHGRHTRLFFFLLWKELVYSKGFWRWCITLGLFPSSGIPPHIPEDGNRSSFRNVVFSSS